MPPDATEKDTAYLDRAGPVGTIHLNRPDKCNALNSEMWAKLIDVVDAADADPAIKVVVLTGVGGTFAAGQDIEEMAKGLTDPAWPEAALDVIYRSQKRLHLSVKPTIAKIRGACIGGGNGIALCCDLRFADTTARFGITPGKLGLVYPALDTKRLVDVVGPARAKDMLFTGRVLDAEEAMSFGMIDRLVAPADLDATVAAYAASICAASQHSARNTKRMVQAILDGLAEETPETRKVFTESFKGDDFREGQAAFMAKRKPQFKFS